MGSDIQPTDYLSYAEDKRWLRHTLFSRNALLLGIFFLTLSPGLYVDRFKAYISLSIALGILLMYMIGLIIIRKKAKYLPVYVMLISAFIPSIMIGFIGAVIGLLLFVVNWPPKNLDMFTKLVFLFTGFLFLTWLVHLGYTTDFWCLPLYLLTFCSYILVVVFAQWRVWTPRELDRLARLWFLCIALQALPLVIKPLAIGQPKMLLGVLLGGASFVDNNVGTLLKCHYLGILLLLLVVFFLFLFIEKHKLLYMFLAGIYAFLFSITGTRHALLAVLPAVVITVFYWLNFQKKQKLLYFLSIIFVLLLLFPFSNFFLGKFNTQMWNPYVVNLENPKTMLYKQTFDRFIRGDFHSLVGFGPGSYGSRVASSRATEVLYKESYKLPSFIPPFTSSEYREALEGLYTYEIALFYHRSHSATLSHPFASFIGILAELGIIGMIILLLIYVVVARRAHLVWQQDKVPIWRVFGGTAFFAVFFLGGLMFFDSHIEQPNVMIPCWTLFLMVLLRARFLIRSSKM